MTSFRDIPILILIFNRPEKVRRLIDCLEQFQPRRIYISADGPRNHKPGEAALCHEAQKIATGLHWPCEIQTHFSDTNLGCKQAVSQGISWFFEQVPEGIILEDDCLPTESFLFFSAVMLDLYRDNDSIMHINGTSFLPAVKASCAEPYFFSKIAHSWGWATWRRAWEHYDANFSNLSELRNLLTEKRSFTKRKHIDFLCRHFAHIQEREIDSWANPWFYSILKEDGLCVTPTVNLIDNIGFDNQATNTHKQPHYVPSAETSLLSVLKKQTPRLSPDIDRLILDKVYIKNFFERLTGYLHKCYDTFITHA